MILKFAFFGEISGNAVVGTKHFDQISVATEPAI